VVACSDSPTVPTAESAHPSFAGAPAPTGLTTIAAGGTSIELWPYLGPDLETAHDPLSLLVAGEGDPRRIRAALLSLNGDRSALPPPFTALAQFDCTWTDGIGDEQATYVSGPGWTASAIQLECGAFGPAPRFHVRLFDAGDAVLIGGAPRDPGAGDDGPRSTQLRFREGFGRGGLTPCGCDRAPRAHGHFHRGDRAGDPDTRL
jgi:hypothetical protein